MAAIQIVRFKLNAGSNVEAFQALNERFQREVVPTLAGLIRREATVSNDGEYLLVLRYKDVESAQKAGGSDTSDISKQFMSFIDMTSLSVSFHTIISE
jgi:hypothetical protein